MIEIEKHLGHYIYVAKYIYTDKTKSHAIQCMDCLETVATEIKERENATQS
jgi:hypothetical protein